MSQELSLAMGRAGLAMEPGPAVGSESQTGMKQAEAEPGSQQQVRVSLAKGWGTAQTRNQNLRKKS